MNVSMVLPGQQDSPGSGSAKDLSTAEVSEFFESLLLACSAEDLPAPPGEPCAPFARLLEVLQRTLGCQGIGYYREQSGAEWVCLVGRGGRSLGRIDADWLNQVSASAGLCFRLDEPAQGWGQWGIPFHWDAEQAETGVLVVTSRNPEVLPGEFLKRATPWLERLSQSLRERQRLLEVLRTRQQLVAALSRIHATETLPDLLRIFQAEFLQFWPHSCPEVYFRPNPAGESVFRLNIDDEQAEPCSGEQKDDSSPSRPATGKTASACPPALQQREAIVEGRVTVHGEPLESSLFAASPAEEGRLLVQALARRIDQLQRQDQSVTSVSEDGEIKVLGEIRSQAARQLQAETCALAKVRLPLLIVGPKGCGKSQVARLLHENGATRGAPCRELHSARLDPATLQSLLGISSQRVFPLAGFLSEVSAFAGTIILREVNRLAPACQQILDDYLHQQNKASADLTWQPRLLFTCTGDNSDFSLIPNLIPKLARRISVIRLAVPGLRERHEDIIPLVQTALRKRIGSHAQTPRFSQAAEDFLVRYAWPGNFRDIAHLIEKLAHEFTGQELTPFELERLLPPRESRAFPPSDAGLAEATLEFQRQFIRQAIAECRGNMTEAARHLGLHRSNLYRKMQQLGMVEAEVAAEQAIPPQELGHLDPGTNLQ
ncbi:MAG: sigma-54-dependent Fis family transcriptional regulator [Planctomycetaceae bacterium]|nr:sigma-54-dependent Fis family transcriptional regulator [Planctomycetaceae bacterium]